MLDKFRPRHMLLSTTLLGSVACIVPAHAQDVPGGEAAIEDTAPIVVTGSRIQNPNLEQSSPVQVVGETEIGLRQATNAEELIGDLPGVSPGANSAVNNGGGGGDSFTRLGQHHGNHHTPGPGLSASGRGNAGIRATGRRGRHGRRYRAGGADAGHS